MTSCSPASYFSPVTYVFSFGLVLSWQAIKDKHKMSVKWSFMFGELNE